MPWKKYLFDIQNFIWIPKLRCRPSRDCDEIGHEANNWPANNNRYNTFQPPLSPPLLFSLNLDEIIMFWLEIWSYSWCSGPWIWTGLEEGVRQGKSNQGGNGNYEEREKLTLLCVRKCRHQIFKPPYLLIVAVICTRHLESLWPQARSALASILIFRTIPYFNGVEFTK